MYFLMNKDKAIASFTITAGDFGDVYTFVPEENARLPYGFTYIEHWLENRKASKHNAHLRQIMKDCGCENTTGFIQITHAASINDTFWVKKEGEEICWDQVSFYKNKFDETISRLAFEGMGLYGIKISSTSPELSTDGSFRKCWRKEQDGIYLYKRGSSGARNSGLEPYCEVLGSEIARIISKNAVSYELVRLHGELASKCRVFTDEQHGYVPIARFALNHSSPNDILRFYEKIGCEDDFRRMIVIDALTFNVDRHGGNHGVLVDNDTLVPVQMAPIFDMNLSMLPYVEEDEFQDIGKKLAEYGPKIGEDFTRLGQQAVTSEIRSQLINLKGYQFTFHGDERFPAWRVKTMERLIDRQIDALLSKTQLYTKDVFIPRIPCEDKAEKEEKRKEEIRIQEILADELQGILMEKGISQGILAEICSDRVLLHVAVPAVENTELIVDLKTGQVTAEQDGIEFLYKDILQEKGLVYQAYLDTAKVVDDFLAERPSRF